MSFGLPTRVAMQPTGLYLELRDIPPAQLTDPFLQETVVRVRSTASYVQIMKADLHKSSTAAPPAGIVFHVGRCGSTLLSQLLKQCPGLTVYSEPLAINELLVPPHKWTRAELIGALRSVAAQFARHARGPYVFKLSSWNTLFADLVLEAFPKAPWTVCVRDPVEVCVSLFTERPGWLKDAGQPSNLFASLVDPDCGSASDERFIAKLFGAYCEAIRRSVSRNGRLTRYESLPSSIWRDVAKHFGAHIDRETEERMAAASANYSKAPVGQVKAFASDGERKRSAASPSLIDCVDSVARPGYEALLSAFSSDGNRV